MTGPTTRNLGVPGATLAYDVREGEGPEAHALLMIGSPMGAAGFATLAGRFPDRTVATYDPRGVERSEKTDPATISTPDEHADDLHRLIDELGGEAVDVFASSGGAVNALALVARHPEQVRTLVAHEPPMAQVVPDREAALAACRAVAETYDRAGFGAGMAHFIVLVSHRGPFTDDVVRQPPPDPAAFGMPADDDGSRWDPLLGQNLVSCTHHVPDLDALRAASTTIVMAAGVGSDDQLAHRAAEAMAGELGGEAVAFPGDHGGFLGGEYGQTGEPGAFADALRAVLAETTP